ncbi:unnamed protein product [Polarella glacialis]|nr:unnamed protein product [Polarella glacialis]
MQGESLDIIRALDSQFPGSPQLWPDEEVTKLVDAFKTIFPKQTRPSSRAAYLYSWNGPIFRSQFEETLSSTDELLGRHGGPFFFGPQISAADCAWAPFLERYAAQLPCLQTDLRPYDVNRWPRLAAWCDAMQQVPSYSCRVRGDEVSWRKVLAQAGYGNDGVVSSTVEDGSSKGSEAGMESVWAAYARDRPYVAVTPQVEAAARLLRNRAALSKDAVKRGVSEAEVDHGLRGVAALLAGLCNSAVLEGSPAVAAVAAYLDDRMCVPRDMGLLPSEAIRSLARRLST